MDRPSIFIACPGDVAYLRPVARSTIEALKSELASSEALALYDYEVDKHEHPWDSYPTPQEQIPLPSDPNCLGVVCLFGERLGTPLGEDFPVDHLDGFVHRPGEGSGPRCVHPWTDEAAADPEAFPLTGSTFELLCVFAENARREARGEATLPLFVRFVGSETLERQKQILTQQGFGFGNAYFAEIVHEDDVDEKADWLRDHYKPSLMQVANLKRFLGDHRSKGRLLQWLEPEQGAGRNRALLEKQRASVKRLFADELDRLIRAHLLRRETSPRRDPFKALDFYDVEDAPVFFGRADDVHGPQGAATQWLQRIKSPDMPSLLTLVGPSGAGKSSLLRAGVLAHMIGPHAPGNFVHVVVRAGDLRQVALGTAPGEGKRPPLASLVSQCLHRLAQSVDERSQSEIANLGKAGWDGPAAAAEVLDDLVSRIPANAAGDYRLLIAIDQFEEIVDDVPGLAAGETDLPDWRPLLDFVEAAAVQPRLGVALTLETRREADFKAHCKHLAEATARKQIGLPNYDIVRGIIDGAFRAARRPIGDPAVLSEIADAFDRLKRGDVRGDDWASLLPFLSVGLKQIDAALEPLHRNAMAAADSAGVDAATRAWAALRSSDAWDGLLDFPAAIACAGDEAVQGARSEFGPFEDADDILRRLFRRYVRLKADGTARPLTAPRPRKGAAAILAARLCENRLLKAEGVDRLRLSHARIVEAWDKAREWRDAEATIYGLADDLEPAAKRWDSRDRQDSALPGAGSDAARQALQLMVEGRDLFADFDDIGLSADHALVRDFALAMLRRDLAGDTRIDAEGARLSGGGETEFTGLIVAIIYRQGAWALDLLAAAPAAARHCRASNGRSPLLTACRLGVRDLIAALITAAPELAHHPDTKGWRPLDVASYFGSLPALEILFENGLKVDETNPQIGTFPLLLAAQNGHEAVVQLLLEAGASPHQIGPAETPAKGSFPLLLAAQNGHEAVVRRLLKADHPDGPTAPNNVDPIDGIFPLLLAAQNGHTEIVAALLEAGAEPNKKHKTTGTFPLLQAAQNGHEAVVRRLLEAGASPHQTGAAGTPGEGTFPLLMAAQNGHEAVVRRLLKADGRVDPNKVNKSNGTFPLLMAAQNGHEEVMRQLLNAGASPNQTGAAGTQAEGAFPLLLAAQYGHEAIVQLLLEAGAKPNAMDALGTPSKGPFPLLLAAEYGHEAVVRLLLEADHLDGFADPNKMNKSNGTFPLLMAARNGHGHVVSSLLAVGADINQAVPDWSQWAGEFALLQAVRKSHTNVVKLLLAHPKIDVHKTQATTGETALSAARKTGNAEIIAILEAAASG